jgi:hypothetical protein
MYVRKDIHASSCIRFIKEPPSPWSYMSLTVERQPALLSESLIIIL